LAIFRQWRQLQRDEPNNRLPPAADYCSIVCNWLVAPIAGVFFAAQENVQEEFCADLDRA
jgi:hypothetical protein